LDAARQKHARLAQHAATLAAADARLAELETKRADAARDADEQLAAAEQRHATRVAELQAQAATLDAAIAALTTQVADAEAACATAAADNSAAVVLKAQLATARAEWDRLTTT